MSKNKKIKRKTLSSNAVQLADRIKWWSKNGDGFIDILDVLSSINTILNNPQTTVAEQETLQIQLDRLNRLNVGKTTQDRQLQTLKQLPNDKTRRLFRNVYPL